MVIEEIRFLGIRLTPMTIREMVECIGWSLEGTGPPTIISNHNLHSLYLMARDEEFRRFYERADFTVLDGVSMILISRVYGYVVPYQFRATCIDYLRPLITEASTRGWRIFFLGGRPGIAALALQKLGVDLNAGQFTYHHGYFDTDADSDENRDVLARIRRARPDILLVGMGMPRQERWIIENLDRITARAILNVGACMDYYAGAAPMPPRWIGRLGLEWVFRLASEPRRLAFRYLIEPWVVARRICKDLCVAHRRRTDG